MKRFGLALLLLAFLAAAAAAQEPTTYDIRAAESRLEVGVFRGGLLKVFGHDHRVAARELTGEVRFDPARPGQASLALSVAASSLALLDSGESAEDRREIQATMLSDRVLGVETFPQIGFRSSGVSEVRKTGDGWDLVLAGTLTLHGVARPLAFPVQVRLDADRLRGRGEVELRQSDFGIKPISVAGGLVQVKNPVRVSFDLVAVRRSP